MVRHNDARMSVPPAADSTVALITGGEGDLARAVREQLELHGCTVHSPGRRDLNVADAASITAFFERVPKLDLLVHCAGVLRDHMFSSMTDEDFDTVLDVNLKGAFRVSQAALQYMAK